MMRRMERQSGHRKPEEKGAVGERERKTDGEGLVHEGGGESLGGAEGLEGWR